MCLQGHHETGLQLGYLGLSLGFGSSLPLSSSDNAADPDTNTNHWRRHTRIPHDRGPLVQIRADVQDFRVNREGSARCDGLLFDDRLGASDGDDLHFDDGRSESPI